MKVFKFSSMATALSFRNRCDRAMLIVLGCDGKYWVCSGRTASELVALGYEVAA